MKRSFESICAQEFKDERKNHAHVLPIYASSSFVFDDTQQGIDIFKKVRDGHVYARYGNPTCETVEQKLAALASYDTDLNAFALLTNSGMSAINTLFSALLSNGDAVLTQGNLYGGTTELLQKVLSRMGIEPIFIDLGDEKQILEHIQNHPKIKMIYFETPANPTLSCIDLSKISAIAQEHQLISVVDNTFQTPYLQRPLQYGIDYELHSTTKFLNGHGNSISGCIIGKDQSNREKVWNTFKLIGSNCSPFEAWLLNNGLKTLTLRMDRHCQNALALAQALEIHHKVAKVNYPGLSSHPSHEVAKRQMAQFGGMLSFELKGGIEAGIKLMDNLQMATLAPTLGDVDTLVLHPASSSHINVSKELRAKNGITDGMIRVSVGIESSEDLIHDFIQAIDRS